MTYEINDKSTLIAMNTPQPMRKFILETSTKHNMKQPIFFFTVHKKNILVSLIFIYQKPHLFTVDT